MGTPILIYHAAALFSGRETFFNAVLNDHLERLGYHTLFPQRDGFEFGNLQFALRDKLQPGDVSAAVQTVIYFLDMGEFIPKSDVVVANLDEPLDDGVIVEISYAKLMGIPVVGFRTDVRSPFGEINEPLGGIHFFPAYQCDFYISQAMPSPDIQSGDEAFNNLAQKINTAIDSLQLIKKRSGISNKIVQNTLEGARILFQGIDDIHSPAGLETIAHRYMENSKILQQLGPKVFK